MQGSLMARSLAPSLPDAKLVPSRPDTHNTCHLRLATRMASSGVFEDGPALVLSHSGRLVIVDTVSCSPLGMSNNPAIC